MSVIAKKLRFYYRGWRYRLRTDPGEITFLLRRLSPGQTAVDIGAHKGAYSLWMRKAVGGSGRVFSFEPQPELADYLREINHICGFTRVTVENCGLSDACGKKTLRIPSLSDSPGATLQSNPALQAHRALNIRVDTLDHYFADNAARPIRLIKCDVEGHELEVFRGGERILREDNPLLLFECESRHHAGRSISPVFAFLEKLGYRGLFFLGRQLRSVAEFDEGRDQDPSSPNYVNNFVFLPKGDAVEP